MSRIVNNYVLSQTPLSTTPYSTVYMAHHITQNTPYAVKVLSNLSPLKSVEIESTLPSHPNIVKLLSTFTIDNHIYCVYEFCEEGNLDSLLMNNGPLSEELVWEILYQMVQAFVLLQKLEIVHRDIKPANIMIKNGIFKLTDFGLCEKIDEKSLKFQKLENFLRKYDSKKINIVGSPIYMAPELLKNEIINSKCDIYSLGVMMYELLFGVCPYEEKEFDKLSEKKEKGELLFPPNKTVSIKMRDLLRKMLRPDPIIRIDLAELSRIVDSQKKNNSPMTLECGYNEKKNEDNSFAVINRKVIKERNKVVYLANVIAATLDLNLNGLSPSTIRVFLNTQAQIYNDLINCLKNETLAFDFFKINDYIWVRYKNSDYYPFLIQKLEEERSKLLNKIVLFKSIVPFESDDLTIKSYINSVYLRAQSHLKENEFEKARKVLLHVNNLIDNIDIHLFFKNKIDEENFRLNDQTYFDEVMAYSLEELQDLVHKKLENV